MKKILLLFIVASLIFALNCSSVSAKTVPSKDNRIDYLNIGWWKNYDDSILTDYLIKVYSDNHDLKIATLKVKEGEKLVKISFSQELPQINFSPRFERTMESSDIFYGNVEIPNFAQSNFMMPLTMSYEVDIWGKNRNKTKSIEKKVQMVKQDERASYISLTSAFAAEYFNLVKIDKLIDIQKELIKTQKNVLSLVKQKYESGLCPLSSVIDEEKNLSLLCEKLNNLEEKQDMLENQISVYLSDASSKDLIRVKYDNLRMIKDLPQKIDSDIVENRPDVIKSEDNLQAIGYDVKVAKKDFLPNFLIFGQLGFNAYDWGKMFNTPSRMASAGVLPTLDIFSGGRKIAMLKLKKYEYEEAVQRYQKTILTSFQEVNDSLVSVKISKKNFEDAKNRTKLEKDKFNLISAKTQIGATSNLELLYYKEKLLLTQQTEVSNKINYIISSINLYKSVGGKDLYALFEKSL